MAKDKKTQESDETETNVSTNLAENEMEKTAEKQDKSEKPADYNHLADKIAGKSV